MEPSPCAGGGAALSARVTFTIERRASLIVKLFRTVASGLCAVCLSLEEHMQHRAFLFVFL